MPNNAKASPTNSDANVEKPKSPQQLNEGLRAECAVIDARAEFVGRDENETIETRVLLKIEAYAAWRERHGITTGIARRDGKLMAKKMLVQIGHGSVTRTAAITSAIKALQAEIRAVGKLRHHPETQIDLDLDRYEILINERGYGPPRKARKPTAISLEGVAAELGCEKSAINDIALRRLKVIAASSEPGPAFGTERVVTGRKDNPAIRPLVEAGLATFREGLPEDPLMPGEIDFNTFCEVSGVGVIDVVQAASIQAIIVGARGNTPLVPSKYLADRRYSYKDLIEWARDDVRDRSESGALPDDDPAKDPGVASRKDVHALRGFLGIPSLGSSENALVPYDFKERVERSVAAHASSFAHGWRGLMRRWIRWNDAMRSSRPMPKSFALRLRILCRETGNSPGKIQILFSELQGDVKAWATGVSHPSAGAEPLVKAIARHLRVPLPVLKDTLPDLWRARRSTLELLAEFSGVSRFLPFDYDEIEDEDEQRRIAEEIFWTRVRQGTPYGRRQSRMCADTFSIPLDEWQPEMRDAWTAMLPKPSNQGTNSLRGFADGLRPRDNHGNPIAPNQGWRAATMKMRVNQLSFLFGYLARPRIIQSDVEDAATELDFEDGAEHIFTKEGGLEIPPKLIKPGILALVDIPTAFAYWRVRRSGRFVNTVIATFKLVASMLRPETGIIWKSPHMLQDLIEFKKWWNAHPHETPDGVPEFDIEPFEANWQTAVEMSYAILRDEIKLALQRDLKPSRDTFLPVGVFVEHERPMELYMAGVRKMLSATPQSIILRHGHNRNCVMALILVQTGLRAYNMKFTFDAGDGGPRVRCKGRNGKALAPTLLRVSENGVTKWTVRIPASEFKNFRGPFFKGDRPYEYVLRDEDNLYDRIAEYVDKGRKYFLRGRKSDAFFITSTGNDMTEGKLSECYRTCTGNYLVCNDTGGSGGIEGSMIHGMHAVRNIIATHIVKVTGDLYLAAWAIQDSPKTLEKHYARFIPIDKIKHAAVILEEARAAGKYWSLPSSKS